MAKSFEVVSARVEELDAFSATVVCLLCDAETGEGLGEVWLVAGVRPHMEGTANAAASWRELESVWAYGDSLDCWCPDGLFAQHEDVLEACYGPALAAWREADAAREA